MGCLKDPNYVREFAFRTKLNYYRNMALYSDNKEKYLDRIKDLENQMVQEDYIIENYYEVTDLLNSLIGLLIFPEQNMYNSMSNNENDLKTFSPSLFLCTQSVEYVNTYEKKYRADMVNSPKNVIKHLRNSFSHDRVMLFPRNKKDEGKIEKIILQDCQTRDKDMERKREIDRLLKKHFGDIRELDLDIHKDIELFSLEIPIELLEDVFMEICDYALRISK